MKDALGNDLHEGDLIALQLERPLVFGRIAEIEEGGIVSGINGRGEAQMRPGRVIVDSKHVIDVDPRLRVAAVLALRDNTAPEAAALPDKPSHLAN